MAKSVVNPEFKAATAALFSPAGFIPRAKGSRRPELILPLLCFPGDPGVKVEKLGVSKGYSDQRVVIDYDVLVVTYNGVRVPAYRRSSPLNVYNICQDLTFVPVG
jgi:hypothetical protein